MNSDLRFYLRGWVGTLRAPQGRRKLRARPAGWARSDSRPCGVPCDVPCVFPCAFPFTFPFALKRVFSHVFSDVFSNVFARVLRQVFPRAMAIVVRLVVAFMLALAVEAIAPRSAAKLFITSATAADLGALGPTYPITEPHLLQMIQERLKEAARTGELARIEDQARRRSVELIRHPPPVPDLVTTRMPRTFFLDPSLVLDRNVLGPSGELLFTAGMRKNPLEVTSLSRPLLFFDARDTRQVRQAQAFIALHEGRVKPILTGGSYMQLMQTWRMPVYFDQGGSLSRRLGIRQVPARVTQQGLRLRIDELEVLP